MRPTIYLILALIFIGCNLDNTAPEPDREYTLLPCATNSAQAADTTNYAICTEPRPPSPGGGVPDTTFSPGGVD